MMNGLTDVMSVAGFDIDQDGFGEDISQVSDRLEMVGFYGSEPITKAQF